MDLTLHFMWAIPLVAFVPMIALFNRYCVIPFLTGVETKLIQSVYIKYI